MFLVDGVDGSGGSNPGLLGDDDNFLEDQILSRVNRRRGRKKVIQAAEKRKGDLGERTLVKRGRPKGSRNKTTIVARLPSRTQEGVGIESSVAWAQQAWSLGKQLGVVFDGDDDEMVKKLAVKVRKNHPNFR